VLGKFAVQTSQSLALCSVNASPKSKTIISVAVAKNQRGIWAKKNPLVSKRVFQQRVVYR
jgi:hypothetical protein